MSQDREMHAISLSKKAEMVFNPFDFRDNNSSHYPFVPISPKRRIQLHFAFWIISFCLVSSFVVLVRPVSESLGRALMMVICLASIFYGSRILVSKFYENKLYTSWVSYSLLLVLLVAGFRTWVDLYIFRSIIFKADVFAHIESVKIFRLYFFYLLIGILFITLGSFYYIAKNRLAIERHFLELKLQHVEAQLNFLKAQVNPHFLFNTLNNIYAAAELKSSSAPAMILNLSHLLRYITYTVKQKSIHLQEEWEQIENYVKLYCFRNPNEQFPIEIKTEGDFTNIKIPPMILLPIVENAFKYTDMHENAPNSYFKINLTHECGQLRFVVINTYSPSYQHPKTDRGIGNDNIRQRLSLEFPGRHLLNTEKKDGIFTADLILKLNDGRTTP